MNRILESILCWVVLIVFVLLIVFGIRSAIIQEKENPCVEYEKQTYYTTSKWGWFYTTTPHTREVCVRRAND